MFFELPESSLQQCSFLLSFDQNRFESYEGGVGKARLSYAILVLSSNGNGAINSRKWEFLEQGVSENATISQIW